MLMKEMRDLTLIQTTSIFIQKMAIKKNLKPIEKRPLRQESLKIIQTHKEYIALNFIQRNRNQAKGLVIIPTSWAKYNQTILETITLSSLPTAAIYFEPSFSFGTQENESILQGENIKPFTGNPIDTTISAIDYISKL